MARKLTAIAVLAIGIVVTALGGYTGFARDVKVTDRTADYGGGTTGPGSASYEPITYDCGLALSSVFGNTRAASTTFDTRNGPELCAHAIDDSQPFPVVLFSLGGLGVLVGLVVLARRGPSAA